MRKVVPVDPAGGTIWARTDQYIALLSGTETFIIKFSEYPQFKGMKFREGDVVWFYRLRGMDRVESILPGSQVEKLEDLPKVPDLEIDTGP